MERLFTAMTLSAIAAGTLVLSSGTAHAADTPHPVANPTAEGCAADPTWGLSERVTGYAGSNLVSYQLAGPGTIHSTQTETATSTMTFGTQIGMAAGVLLAKAETTFKVDYATSTSSSKAWGYDIPVAPKRTAVAAVLHRQDKMKVTKYYTRSNCTEASVSTYAHIPTQQWNNADWCIIRDYAPYNYTSWRQTCASEQ